MAPKRRGLLDVISSPTNRDSQPRQESYALFPKASMGTRVRFCGMGICVKGPLTTIAEGRGLVSALVRILDHSGAGLEARDPAMANVSEVIDRLVRRRAELRAEIAKLDQVIEGLTALSDVIGSDDLAINPVNAQPELSPREGQRERGVLPPEEIVRFARNALLKNGRPLKRGALARALEAEGVPLAGKDKAKNLGTILWRNLEEFVSLDKLGYWPRDISIKGVYDAKNPPDRILSPRLKDAS